MANRGKRVSSRAVAGRALGVLIVAVLAAWPGTSAQVAFPTGQNVVPVYEGWEQNPDGSFNLVFGYFNRNFEEEIDLAVGADNTIEPGGPDQGQPTHFYPRRNRFLVRIRVPKDFGTKELVWTLTSHGKTGRAYATLKPDYVMNDIIIMNNNGAGGSGGGGFNINSNKPPTLKLDGEKSRAVTVGQPIALTAVATDDGIPKRRVVRSSLSPRASAAASSATPSSATPSSATPSSATPSSATPSSATPSSATPSSATPSSATAPTYIPAKIAARCCPDSASGLRLAWFVYRGPADKVTFDPPQFEVWEDYRDGRNSPWSEGWETPPVPADGKWSIRATFTEPGTYVLRCLAHDGGLVASEDVTFVVTKALTRSSKP